MNRARFAALAGTFAATAARALAAPPAFVLTERIRPGARLSLREILAQYPTAVSGDMVQYELGFGAAYDKQIGFGHETDGDERLAFVETQVGNGDHACNPNTLKKVYLKTHAFGSVFEAYPTIAYVSRSGNMLTRWGDGVGPAAPALLLLDTKTLYDPRRATIEHVGPATVSVGGRPIAATHVAARYAPANDQHLRTAELWLSPAVPLGLVKMKATAPDVDPFELSLYTYTRHFKTELAMTLNTVRALTPAGEVPVLQ